MNKNSTAPHARPAKTLSPDVLEFLHMLSALESQPRPLQPEAPGK